MDLNATNLAAEEELDALLAGLPSVGRTIDPIRVAVPPLRVTGEPGGEWLGEAAADIVGSELSTARGVVPIDRGELGPVAATEADAAAAAGRAIGAHVVVLGSISRAGSELAVELAFVHVGSGEVVRSSARVAPDLLDETLRRRVDAAFARYGVTLGTKTVTVVRPLPFDRLEQAARARALQARGKLTEAQPLYAAALAEPSSAWRFEADYLQLMNDLGQREWARARANTVLTRMPSDDALLCDRTRVTLQRNRSETTIHDVREAVQMAASCGERQLVGMALFYYAVAFETRHYPIAREAITRAEGLVSPKLHPSTRCFIDYTRARHTNEAELAMKGPLEERFAAIARTCAAAGNMRLATFATMYAAMVAWNPARRLEYDAKAIEYAAVVGGEEHDRARIAAANTLRAAGRVSEADERLLEVMRDHLTAIIALYGALPFDEQKLDDDLLARARVARPSGVPREPSGSTALLARTHRAALASVLRAWADRTRPVSAKQAATYAAIASDIAATPREPESLAKRLAEKHQLTVEQILASPKAPSHASASNLADAFWILDSMFFEVRDVEGKRERADELRRASKRVASWVGRNDLIFEAAILDIDMHVVRGEFDDALTAVRATERYVASSASHRRRLIDRELWMAGKLNDRPKQVAARERDVEAARALSASTWITALYWLEHARLALDPQAFLEGARRLEDAAQELEQAGAFEPAAEAYANAAHLMNYGRRADGTIEAVELHGRRVAVIGRLGDPLRTAMARADLLKVVSDVFFHSYRGNAGKQLKAYGPATALVGEIARTCTELVAAGRHRDAVRLVTNLPPAASGVSELVDRAMEWAKTFKSSTEYLGLKSTLHYMRATIAEDQREKIAQFDASREAAVADKNLPYALSLYRLMLGHVRDEAELWAMYDRCVALGATAKPIEQVECPRGLAHAVQEGWSKPIDARRAAEALKHAVALTPAADTSVSPQWRMDWRGNVAVLAGLAGDWTTFETYVGEIEKYYTATAPDAYQLATALARIAGGLRVTGKRAVAELLRKFYRSGGIGEYWIATAAVNDARYAESVGDLELEAEILGNLKRAVRVLPAYAYNVPSYEADRANRKKDYKRAEAAYLEAAETVRKNTPRELRLVAEYQLHAAMAAAKRRDLAGARARLAPILNEARTTPGQAVARPCLVAQALEVASAIEHAGRRCREGAELRALAETVREQCTKRVCDTESSWFCDVPAPSSIHAANACGKAFAVEWR